MFEYVKDLGLMPQRPYTRRKNTDLIILHHFESGASAQAVHAYHISRGHKGIDYNIVVLKSGEVVWGRGLEFEGGHTSNAAPRTKGVNARSVGIACQGNFNLEKMETAQKDALCRVARDVADFYRITDIKGHREISGTDYTDCPGNYYPLGEARDFALMETMEENRPTFHITRNLGRGTKDAPGADEVRAVQRNLGTLGYAAGAADGIFGPRTEGAVKKFQADFGLKADGIVGKNTTRTLGGVWDGN